MTARDDDTVEVPRLALFNALILLGTGWSDGRVHIDDYTAELLNQLCEADGMLWRFHGKRPASRPWHLVQP